MNDDPTCPFRLDGHFIADDQTRSPKTLNRKRDLKSSGDSLPLAHVSHCSQSQGGSPFVSAGGLGS